VFGDGPAKKSEDLGFGTRFAIFSQKLEAIAVHEQILDSSLRSE
jgi:hypothetical protein